MLLYLRKVWQVPARIAHTAAGIVTGEFVPATDYLVVLGKRASGQCPFGIVEPVELAVLQAFV